MNETLAAGAAAVAVTAISSAMQKVVLYAENDSTDIFFCSNAVSRIVPGLDVRFVGNAMVAKDWLAGEGPYANRKAFPIPDLVVTALHLPHMSGHDLLRWIRSQPQFEKLPVVVHSTSAEPEDKALARSLGVSRYLLKDVNCQSLAEYLRDHFGLQ